MSSNKLSVDLYLGMQKVSKINCKIVSQGAAEASFLLHPAIAWSGGLEKSIPAVVLLS